MSDVIREHARGTSGLLSRLDQRGRIAALLIVAVGMGAIAAQGSTLARALVGGLGLLIFIMVAFSGRDTALVLVIVWLALLGLTRRLLIPFVGWAPQDPLLLVSPAAAITLWFAARHDKPPPRSVLAGIAGFLLLWSAAQIVNPNESSILVALQGSLFFYLTPFLWFFAGRTLSGRQHDLVLTTVFWMNIAVAGHGLYQTFFGLLPFEFTWLDASGQGAAIFMPGFRIRPFSTMTSPQEYGYYLSFALMIIWARTLHQPPDANPNRRRWLLLFFGITLVALFYQASRSIFLFMLLALAVTTVVRLRSAAAVLAVGALAGAMFFFTASNDVQSTSPVNDEGRGRAEVLATHQLSGLTNPSGSTAPIHLALIEEGFRTGLENPLGIGASEGTIAQAKATPADSTSAESDIANTMAGLGIPAGLALAFLVIGGIVGAVRMYRIQPTARHLAWLGIFVAAFNQWMNGAMYCTSTILFLSLGGLSREMGELVSRTRDRFVSTPETP